MLLFYVEGAHERTHARHAVPVARYALRPLPNCATSGSSSLRRQPQGGRGHGPAYVARHMRVKKEGVVPPMPPAMLLSQ